MTLEKLLIFGFAIAMVAAITLSATGITDSRTTQKDGYRDKVDALAERAR